jgi:DNA topoisomerase-1
VRGCSGSDFTAKDFRTWAATTLVAGRLAACAEPSSVSAANRSVLAAIDAAAERLGNTRSVCRASYVHPSIVDAFLEGWLNAPPGSHRGTPPPRGLEGLELATLRVLEAAARPRRRTARGKRALPPRIRAVPGS